MGQKDSPMQDTEPSGDQKPEPSRKGNVGRAGKNKQEPEGSQDGSVKFKGDSDSDPDPDVDCSVDSSEKLDRESPTVALAEMFILDELPFKLVKRKRFRNFMSAMDPRFRLPSCITVSNDCSRIHLDEKLKLKQLLSKVDTRICLSAKTWTSVRNLTYLCLTAHFIDGKWKLHRKILNFCPIAGGKGEEIGRIVESSVLDWGIRNLGTFTVENSVPNDVAVKYLKDKFHEQNYLLFGGEFFHIRCWANILNLIVRDCLDETQTSVSRIRDAIKYVRSSTSGAEKFKRCIMKEQITSRSSSICLDVETRWSSTYFMLNSALNFQRAFQMLHGDDPKFQEHLNDGAPTDDDWSNARALVKFLEIAYDTSKCLSSYLASSLCLVQIFYILSTLDEWTKSSESHLQSMALKIKGSFNKHWGSIDESNLLFLISMAFDPRFNVDGVRSFLADVYPTESEKVDNLVNQVTHMMKKLFDYYKQIYLTRRYESAKAQHASGVVYEYDLHQELKKYMEKRDRAKEKEDRAKRELELQRYLEGDYGINDSFDLLPWWDFYGHTTYLVLSDIAKDLFSIPVSTSDSKSACSFGDPALGEFQSSLPPMLLESLICTKDWLETSPHQVEFEEDLEEWEKLEFVPNNLENAGTSLAEVMIRGSANRLMKDVSANEQKKEKRRRHVEEDVAAIESLAGKRLRRSPDKT